MSTLASQAQGVLEFWFQELDPKDWWRKSHQLDSTIARRFGTIHQAACAGECEAWRTEPMGRLAEVIVLDQFSRNIFRDRPEAFAADGMALVLAQTAISAGADQSLDATHKAFLYLPFMHSESALIHERAMQLFNQPGLENNLDFEIRHKAIIDRFGRYPHRNDILGRKSTAEEIDFLQQPGSSF
ncbi:hypothetical protein BTA51_06755 [Hahella sp. CCB-MM4]|uniref:DUF924 family protein n=1 Tax=Hahella sp. (strain CCB-MM4) TaxID=1926491 RepID=UPI000B9B4584|nr:DUF924 family protein [Hahella sp. CCB-MM4]OZG74677.1 hypothetical protein BTA51_06755 [Hahella sp. CCB-MM4]